MERCRFRATGDGLCACAPGVAAREASGLGGPGRDGAAVTGRFGGRGGEPEPPAAALFAATPAREQRNGDVPTRSARCCGGGDPSDGGEQWPAIGGAATEAAPGRTPRDRSDCVECDLPSTVAADELRTRLPSRGRSGAAIVAFVVEKRQAPALRVSGDFVGCRPCPPNSTVGPPGPVGVCAALFSAASSTSHRNCGDDAAGPPRRGGPGTGGEPG